MNSVNSIKKSGNIVIYIIITEKIINDDVYVSVRDYGSGIDESIRKRLFEPFVTSEQEGSGVGLAISRMIIEDHHGKIWAENMSDGGASFTFNLKVCHERSV